MATAMDGHAVDAPVPPGHLDGPGTEQGAEPVMSDLVSRLRAHQGRTDCAGWGGLLSRAAVIRGIDGVVVDGAARGEAAAAQ